MLFTLVLSGRAVAAVDCDDKNQAEALLGKTEILNDLAGGDLIHEPGQPGVIRLSSRLEYLDWCERRSVAVGRGAVNAKDRFMVFFGPNGSERDTAI